jgi:hypothetical protein
MEQPAGDRYYVGAVKPSLGLEQNHAHSVINHVTDDILISYFIALGSARNGPVYAGTYTVLALVNIYYTHFFFLTVYSCFSFKKYTVPAFLNFHFEH